MHFKFEVLEGWKPWSWQFHTRSFCLYNLKVLFLSFTTANICTEEKCFCSRGAKLLQRDVNPDNEKAPPAQSVEFRNPSGPLVRWVKQLSNTRPQSDSRRCFSQQCEGLRSANRKVEASSFMSKCIIWEATCEATQARENDNVKLGVERANQKGF